MKMKVRGWWDRCLCSQLWSFIRLSKYVEITIYQTWQSQAGTVTLRQNSITVLPVSHMMRCDVSTRDTFNEIRERREISLKVSGCNDETKEAGGPSRCQPTHRSCPLLWLQQGRVPGLYCIVVWWEPLLASLFICSDDKQSSNSKDGTPRRVTTLLETAGTCFSY